MPDYLHNHKDFAALLRIVGAEHNIDPALVEKDYWIMHSLYGLQKQGYNFELKGGTSLSKGYGIIHRFSEDIDIHITPPEALGINPNPKNANPKNIQAKADFYDLLANQINIDGITEVIRDHAFDNPKTYNSGGIRLYYKATTEGVQGLKEGILLEVGFDTITPNNALTISSWAYDKAAEQGVPVTDNRATGIACYHPGYTFVEKLQTIATKFRQEQQTGEEKQNLMRQYYDVFSLLGSEQVQQFIGSPEYEAHKETRFPEKDLAIPIAKNQAFLLEDKKLRERFDQRYQLTKSLYYQGQPSFDELLAAIAKWLPKL